jgi:O-antigen/teichoic acid export membrane protein
MSLLILPFVTHVLTLDDYGAASLLSAASVLLTVALCSPLIQLIVRAAARGEDDGPALLRVAGIYCYVVLPAVAAVVAAAFATFVTSALGVAGNLWAIEILAIGFQASASVFAMWVSRARADLSKFVMLSSISILATTASKLVLVVALKLGVLGWVISDLISAVLSAILAVMVVRIPRARVVHRHIRYVLRFTVPLIPHSASLWALSSLSRPAMATVTSLEQVGLLAFGANLAGLAGLALSEINAATLPHYARETFKAPTGETLGVAKWQLIGAFGIPALVGCGVAIAGPWLFAGNYWPAFASTGIILVAQAAFGLYLIPMNYLTQTAGLSTYSALASGAGAFVILALILTLGHRFGAIGAAFATSCGYATMAIAAFCLTRANRLDISWRILLAYWPELVCAVTALALSVTALFSPPGSSPARAFAVTSAALVVCISGISWRRSKY